LLLRMLRRVRRWDMEAAILMMLLQVISPKNRDEIGRAIQDIAKKKPNFDENHNPFAGLSIEEYRP